MVYVDPMELGKRLLFFGEGIALIYIGRFVRELLFLARGYKVSEIITEKDNPAAAIELSSFMIAIAIATTGSMVVHKQTIVGQASDIAITGLLVIVLLLLASTISDKLIFRQWDERKELFEEGNSAFAIARSGVTIATGLMIAGSLGDAASRSGLNLAHLGQCLAWFVLGQIFLLATTICYQKVTPYNDLEEIKQKNLAAGVPLFGVTVAIGLVLSSGIHGVSENLWGDMLAVSLYTIITGFFLYLSRGATDKFLLPRSSLTQEISIDKNIGAGILEATAFIACGFILTFYFT